MITDNLTNTVYFSSLLPKKCPILNAHITEALKKHGVPYAYLSETKDIWCRDFMPIQIEEERFVFYKYTPDYLKDTYGQSVQTNPDDVFQSEANHLQQLLPKSIRIDLVLDGGNVVKCGDTIVMTEKVFVENQDKSRDEVEKMLREAFQCDILFLPREKGDRYGHSDGIVHYVGDGKIRLTNYDDFSIKFYNLFYEILEKRFEIIPLKFNVEKHDNYSWCYINYLQVGKLLLVPQVGIDEDNQALEQIAKANPGCEVVGIPSLEAIKRGGALNCISWNIKV